MNFIIALFQVVLQTFGEFIERIGLGEQWSAFDNWRQRGQNNAIFVAAFFFMITIIVLFFYSCSQKPDI